MGRIGRQQNKVSDRSDRRECSYVRAGLTLVAPPTAGDTGVAIASAAKQGDVRSQPPAAAKQKVAKRTARTTKKRKEAKGGKAGHPGRFHGDILEYFQSLAPDYLALPTRLDGGRNTALNNFWTTTLAEFWRRFSVEDARETMTLGANLDDAAVIESMNEVSINATVEHHPTHLSVGY